MKRIISPKKKIFCHSLLLASSLLIATTSNAATVQFNPSPLFEQIVRPGTGFQDPVRVLPSNAALDQCIASGGQNTPFESNRTRLEAAGLLTGALYFRVMWQQVEPNDNDWQFERIDKLLTCANLRGQAVDLRIMLTDPFGIGEMGLPAWLDDGRTVNGTLHYSYKTSVGSNTEFNVPDFSNPVLRKEHTDLIQALGARFDGHKDLNSIDIGSIGWWGEWHYKANTASSNLHEIFMPDPNIQQEVIQLYIDSFPNTPKVALEGAYFDVLNRLNESSYFSPTANFLKNRPDIGWRADSWGKIYFNDRYNNLVYGNGGRSDTWKTGMVSLEISGNGMNVWPGDASYHPIWESTQRAKNWHVSTINSKLGGFPSQYHQQLRQLSAEMGYRLALQQATFDSSSSAGSNLSVSMDWQNFGLAPLYRKFVISFRLKDANGTIRYQTKSDKSLKGITADDGRVNIKPDVSIPSSLAAGAYTLETALVFNGSNNGVSYENDYTTLAPIAINERRSDKWVQLGSVSITGGGTSQSGFSRIVAGNSDSTNQNSSNYNPKMWRIVDNKQSTGSWSNDGVAGKAYVDLYLDRPRKVTSVQYFDDYARKISVGVFDANGSWVHGIEQISTQPGLNTINFPDQASSGGEVIGSRVSVWSGADFGYVGSNGQLWMSPYEIKVFGNPQ